MARVDLIVAETARLSGNREELLSFFGLVTMMGIKWLPRLVDDHWSEDLIFFL